MVERVGLALAAIRAALAGSAGLVATVAVVAVAGVALYSNPPMRTVGQGERGIRENRFTGEVTQWRDGSVLVLPFMHDMRIYSIRERTYRPEQLAKATGTAPLQSREGLSLGVDLAVRYALDPNRLAEVSRNLPEDIGTEVVEPAVGGVIYKVFARYTVREIFSTRRTEILETIQREVRERLAADGIAVKDVVMGKVDLPQDYRRGMDQLLAEELASEKMRYTLELKDKRVKEAALEAEADKTRREKVAEAAAREQIIAARAQEEAMKHVLPFKERQIQQRKLEADAEKEARIRGAEANAQSRRIEANGEADARRKLADADAYRLESVGKASAAQLAREGAVVTAHPLVIQKVLAEKLSDKVQVIIAPPSSDGVITSALTGGVKR